MIGDRETVIPDLAEPIEMWRCWNIQGDFHTPILRSPQRGTTWPPTKGWESAVIRDDQRNFVTATCSGSTLINPMAGCGECPSPKSNNHYGKGCGLYGYKTIEDLAWDWSPPTWPRFKPHGWRILESPVWGRSLGWGKVYEHSNGYRCEFAMVSALVVVEGAITDAYMDLIERTADFYGVPLEVLPPETRHTITEAHIERSIAEDVAVMKAMSKLIGPAMVETIKDIGTAIKKFSQGFKDVAEALSDFAAAADKTDDDKGDDDG